MPRRQQASPSVATRTTGKDDCRQTTTKSGARLPGASTINGEPMNSRPIRPVTKCPVWRPQSVKALLLFAVLPLFLSASHPQPDDFELVRQRVVAELLKSEVDDDEVTSLIEAIGENGAFRESTMRISAGRPGFPIGPILRIWSRWPSRSEPSAHGITKAML